MMPIKKWAIPYNKKKHDQRYNTPIYLLKLFSCQKKCKQGKVSLATFTFLPGAISKNKP